MRGGDFSDVALSPRNPRPVGLFPPAVSRSRPTAALGSPSRVPPRCRCGRGVVRSGRLASAGARSRPRGPGFGVEISKAKAPRRGLVNHTVLLHRPFHLSMARKYA